MKCLLSLTLIYFAMGQMFSKTSDHNVNYLLLTWYKSMKWLKGTTLNVTVHSKCMTECFVPMTSQSILKRPKNNLLKISFQTKLEHKSEVAPRMNHSTFQMTQKYYLAFPKKPYPCLKIPNISLRIKAFQL